MSWKFPKRVPRTNNPLSPEDLAEGLRPFYEVSGDINEHNIKSSSITSGLTPGVDTASDLAYRVSEVNNYDASALFSLSSQDRYVLTTGWTELNDTATSFSTEGAPFLIFAAIDYGLNEAEESRAQAQFVVTLNGSALIETGVGCFDAGAISPIHEQGVAGLSSRCCIDAVIYVPPGKHTLALAARVLSVPNAENTDSGFIYVRNTQFICVELAR